MAYISITATCTDRQSGWPSNKSSNGYLGIRGSPIIPEVVTGSSNQRDCSCPKDVEIMSFQRKYYADNHTEVDLTTWTFYGFYISALSVNAYKSEGCHKKSKGNI